MPEKSYPAGTQLITEYVYCLGLPSTVPLLMLQILILKLFKPGETAEATSPFSSVSGTLRMTTSPGS